MSHGKVPIFVLMIVTGLSLLMADCSKSSVNNNIPFGMTSLIGGKPFQAFQNSAVQEVPYYQVGGFGVVNGDTVSLTVYVATPVVVNQKISTDDNSAAEIDYLILRNNANYAGYSAYQGQKGPAYYTVTALDTVKHTIQGTFSGTLAENGFTTGAPDSVVITNGQFNSSY